MLYCRLVLTTHKYSRNLNQNKFIDERSNCIYSCSADLQSSMAAVASVYSCCSSAQAQCMLCPFSQLWLMLSVSSRLCTVWCHPLGTNMVSPGSCIIHSVSLPLCALINTCCIQWVQAVHKEDWGRAGQGRAGLDMKAGEGKGGGRGLMGRA